MTSPFPPTPPRNLRELTSIRFFAALAVILFHVYDHLPWLYQLDSGLIRNGYLGVDLFFILSGMILFHVNRADLQAGSFRYRAFLQNRLARIYPLHFVMFTAFVSLYAIAHQAGINTQGEGENWGYAAQHLLLLHAWGTTAGHAWNGPSWSISAEFFAYLLFPLLAAFALRFRPLAGLALSVAIFLGFVFVLSQTNARIAQRSYDFGILRIFPEFLLGVFLGLVMHSAKVGVPILRLLVPGVVTACLIAAHLDLPDVVLILLLATMTLLLGLSAMTDRRTILKHRILVYLGEVSYSTYMVHYILLVVAIPLSQRFFGSQDFPLWYWLAMIGVMYLTSIVSYHLVEIPARRLLRSRRD